jgi:hypothetical protein
MDSTITVLTARHVGYSAAICETPSAPTKTATSVTAWNVAKNGLNASRASWSRQQAGASRFSDDHIDSNSRITASPGASASAPETTDSARSTEDKRTRHCPLTCTFAGREKKLSAACHSTSAIHLALSPLPSGVPRALHPLTAFCGPGQLWKRHSASWPALPTVR